jgi:hypothetical protein
MPERQGMLWTGNSATCAEFDAGTRGRARVSSAAHTSSAAWSCSLARSIRSTAGARNKHLRRDLRQLPGDLPRPCQEILRCDDFIDEPRREPLLGW